jgi:hypothetical protein
MLKAVIKRISFEDVNWLGKGMEMEKHGDRAKYFGVVITDD